MVKKVPVRAEAAAFDVNSNRKGTGAARPAVGAELVPLTLILNAYRAMVNARAAHPAGTLNHELSAAINGFETFFQGRLAPDAVRPSAPGYRIVYADGTDRVVATRAQAAAAVGLTDGSLGVALSRGGGVYRRKRGGSAVTVARV